MSYKNYLMFDFGASNGKATVASFDGNNYKMEIVHRFENVPVYCSGTLYWDILKLYSELTTSVKKSISLFSNINSITLDTWGVDFGFIDKNGKLISNPIHYRDKNRNSVSEELYSVISKERLFELSGEILNFSIYNMYYLKKNKSTEISNAKNFLMMPDLFNYFLTGIVTNEYTIATTSAIYNQREKRWENEILNKLDVPIDIFTDVIMPGTIIAKIQKDVCRELGIKPIKVVASGTHDTAAAVAGIPLTNNQKKNWAFISIGTWNCMGIVTQSPLINKVVFKSGFGNEGAVGGINRMVKNIPGLWLIQQCKKRWIEEKGKDISWDEIVNLSNKANSFNYFIDVDDPIFLSTQTNMPRLIQDYCKSKKQRIPRNIGEISRYIFESLAIKIKYNKYLIDKTIKEKIDYIYIVGGGSRNKLLCQMISDACNVIVSAGPYEAATTGNLVVALKADNEISDFDEGRNIIINSIKVKKYEPNNATIWDEAYVKYKNLFNNYRRDIHVK